MKWLITGGCGFLGSSLVERLLREGEHAIRIVDNLAVGTRNDLAEVARFEEASPNATFPALERGKTVQLVVGDIRNESLMERACESVDTVVHFAASTGVIPSVEDPRMDFEINALGTFTCLDAARRAGVKRFIFASSGAPVGACTPPIHEELACKPISPYGASKLAGEAYCSAFYGSYGVGTVSLRFGNVYGPRSTHKGSVVAKFIKQALAGETLVIYGDGAQTRDFIYIDDLLDAVTRAATADCGGEVFQIATHRETTVNEIAERIAALMLELGGVEVKTRREGARAGEVLRNFSDISKAKRMLGWEPRYDLRRGLEATVRWFLSRA